MKFKDYPNAFDGTSKVDAIPNEAPDIPAFHPHEIFSYPKPTAATNYRIEFN